MDENTKIVLLSLISLLGTIAGYYFGYLRGTKVKK